MPVMISRNPHNFIFEKSRATLFGVLIVASTSLYLASNISTAEAAPTNNWACTGVGVGYGQSYTESLAISQAWRRWRLNAKARCGAKCELPKNAVDKKVRSEPYQNRFRARVKARACYYLPGIGATKSPGVGLLRAPTRLP